MKTVQTKIHHLGSGLADVEEFTLMGPAVDFFFPKLVHESGLHNRLVFTYLNDDHLRLVERRFRLLHQKTEQDSVVIPKDAVVIDVNVADSRAGAHATYLIETTRVGRDVSV